MDGFSKHRLQQLALLNGSEVLWNETCWARRADGCQNHQQRGTKQCGAGGAGSIPPRAHVSGGRAAAEALSAQGGGEVWGAAGLGSDRIPSWSGQPPSQPLSSVVTGREGRVP